MTMVPHDVLISLCRLHMADDPTSLSPEDDAALEIWLNEQAGFHGYLDWIEAFHAKTEAT